MPFCLQHLQLHCLQACPPAVICDGIALLHGMQPGLSTCVACMLPWYHGHRSIQLVLLLGSFCNLYLVANAALQSITVPCTQLKVQAKLGTPVLHCSSCVESISLD